MWQHVDPGYNTLGAYYFVNDFVNYTAGYAGSFWQNKINLSFNAGIQEDNLSKTLSTGNRRAVGGVNLAIIPLKSINLQFNYSTFNDYTHIADPLAEAERIVPWMEEDTLSFTQISSSASTSFSWNIHQDERVSRFLSVNAIHQETSTRQAAGYLPGGSSIFTLAGAYNMALAEKKFSLSASFSFSNNNAPQLQSSLLGPGISLRRQLLNGKLSLNISASHHLSRQTQTAAAGDEETTRARVTVVRGAATLTLKKVHRLTLTPALAAGIKTRDERQNNGSLVVTYGYSFGKEER